MTYGTDSLRRGPWALVADADASAAKRLAGHLRRRGLSAYSTPRGDKALRLACAEFLVLAVVDVQLQDMTGHELVLRLKDVDDRLAIIVTSAEARAQSEMQARQLGILYYAPKPIHLDSLDAVLAQTILGRNRGYDRIWRESSPSSARFSRAAGGAAPTVARSRTRRMPGAR